MPLGSESALGFAGPYGTPLIGAMPAPADPAGGVSCAKACTMKTCPARHGLMSTATTIGMMRDICGIMAQTPPGPRHEPGRFFLTDTFSDCRPWATMPKGIHIMQDIPHFFGLILWNFWTVAAGVMLAFEPVMRWFFPRYDWFAARFVAHEQRRNAAKFAALCAFIFANFLAFHDLSEENRSLKAEKESGTKSPYKWSMLTSDEAVSLREKLRAIPPSAASISCAEDDCGDLARSLRDIFKGLHWSVMCCGYPWGSFDPGIHLWAKDRELKEVADDIEQATSGRLKVEMSARFTWDAQKFPLQITIGPKN